MDEQKPLENKQGEPGEKTEKSEYSFMQETIKDENSRGKKCRKDLLRMAGLGVVFGVCACISFSALKPWLDKKFPGDSQEVVIPKEKEEDNTEEKKADTSNNTEQTLDIVGECMNLPKHVDVMPELTPCGDVGMVSAYLQALANEGVATALVVSHLPLVGYLVSELCPGETPPMFTTSAIACVTLDADGKGEFLWQKSPCNLKMANAI